MTGRREQPVPTDPQRAIDRRWCELLARRSPGTRWHIVTLDPVDQAHAPGGEDIDSGQRDESDPDAATAGDETDANEAA